MGATIPELWPASQFRLTRDSHFKVSGSTEYDILTRLAAPAGFPLPLPRVLAVLAHPDDEVLALGGRLERYRESRLLRVTDGAPRDGEDARAHGFATLDEYRRARRQELEKALADLPISVSQTLNVRGRNELITDKEAAFHLPALAEAVARAIAEFQPEAVLTHPYEGGHPDHDSCAFAVHTALALLPKKVSPIIVEAPFYHAGQPSMETGCFLAHTQSPQTLVRELSKQEQEKKSARLGCFASQRDVLAQFPMTHELFRIAPQYDFARPPHEGVLQYEKWGWAFTGAQFRALARAALLDLQLAARAA